MRLIKFFPDRQSIDKAINSWIRESPQRRCILQVVSHKDGVILLYENLSSHKEEWESVKRSLMKKSKKT
ncbi:MAG: hypothetical protein ISS47_08980 [Candidatus Omnitrophica bacterium]|nr:hypothetical protein [Candidatus Omnitrophota bacterium]